MFLFISWPYLNGDIECDAALLENISQNPLHFHSSVSTVHCTHVTLLEKCYIFSNSLQLPATWMASCATAMDRTCFYIFLWREINVRRKFIGQRFGHCHCFRCSRLAENWDSANRPNDVKMYGKFSHDLFLFFRFNLLH